MGVLTREDLHALKEVPHNQKFLRGLKKSSNFYERVAQKSFSARPRPCESSSS